MNEKLQGNNKIYTKKWMWKKKIQNKGENSLSCWDLNIKSKLHSYVP